MTVKENFVEFGELIGSDSPKKIADAYEKMTALGMEKLFSKRNNKQKERKKMEGLNQFPGNGWEKLPNRLLDPDEFDDDYLDEKEALRNYHDELEIDQYLEEQ